MSEVAAKFGNYEEIEQAVMETPRGRWFLNEYARRQRSQDLSGILAAMERLERALAVPLAGAPESRIDKAIATVNEARASSVAAPENLEARQLKYFRKDEEIFEPAPPARPVAVPAAEPEAKGARLIIRHRQGDDAESRAALAALPEAPAPDLAMPQTTAEEDAPPKRRIVIIRHKAGEEIDVPLQAELAHSA